MTRLTQPGEGTGFLAFKLKFKSLLVEFLSFLTSLMHTTFKLASVLNSYLLIREMEFLCEVFNDGYE